MSKNLAGLETAQAQIPGSDPRMPLVAHAEPCGSVVGMDRAVEFTAEGRTAIACVYCRWWLTDVTGMGGPREFAHETPIVRSYADMVEREQGPLVAATTFGS